MKIKAPATDQLKQAWQNRQQRGGFASVGTLVRALIKSQGLDRPSPLAALRSVWEDMVGSELSQHSSLEGVRRGSLRVLVDSAVHMAELQTLIRAGLAERLGERYSERPISQIRLRLGHCSTRRAAGSARRSKRKESWREPSS